MSVKVIIEINGEEQTVELPDEIAVGLTAIASRNGLSMADALLQAIVNENFLEDIQASGAKLLIEKDDRLRELIREPSAA